jgi:pheromone shutdown protein TraB
VSDAGVRNATTVLVIGTCHEYQRHQDNSAEREKVRAELEKLIRTIVSEKGIDLIAEEAGNDDQVHAQLKADEAKTPEELKILFAETKAVDKPQPTIAKIVADEILNGNHVDIRPAGADPLAPDADANLISERDTVMAAKIVDGLGSARSSVLVICGGRHRAGLTTHLTERGWLAASRQFPEQR